MMLGPVQLVVLGFGESTLPRTLIEQFRRWSENGAVRVIDALVVAKNDQGDLSEIKEPVFSQDQPVFLGTLARGLFESPTPENALEAKFGLLATEEGEFGLDHNDIDQIADLIPRSSTVILMLLEHLWAIELKERVIEANGAVIAQGWITPTTLTAHRSDRFDDDTAFAQP